MNKALKALENIRYIIVFDERLVDEDGDDDPKKIFIDKICPQDYAIIEKSLKALQIIKEKRVDVRVLQECSDLEEYNEYISTNWNDKKEAEYHNELLTQEDFDLFREVLL